MFLALFYVIAFYVVARLVLGLFLPPVYAGYTVLTMLAIGFLHTLCFLCGLLFSFLHEPNDELHGERAITDRSTAAPQTGSLGLLTAPVHQGLYSFHNLPNPRYRPRIWTRYDAHQELVTSPAPRFTQCMVYVELDGIHHATLNVTIEGPANAPIIRVLSSTDRVNWTTLDVDTQTAVDQFVADCHAGQILLNQQTVEFYLSRAALRVSLLDEFRCIDHPSWVRLFAETAYFDAHTAMTGTAIFEAYRESLALIETTDAGLYQLAVEAARRVGEPDCVFIEVITENSANE